MKTIALLAAAATAAVLSAPASARLLADREVPGMPGVLLLDDLALAVRTGATDADAVAMYSWIRGGSNQARGFGSRAQYIAAAATPEFAALAPLHLVYAKRASVRTASRFLLPVASFSITGDGSVVDGATGLYTFAPAIDGSRLRVNGPDASTVCATTERRQYCVYVAGTGAELNALRPTAQAVFAQLPVSLLDGKTASSRVLRESGVIAWEIELPSAEAPYAASGARTVNARYVRTVLLGGGARPVAASAPAGPR